jgi:hypothetical protein
MLRATYHENVRSMQAAIDRCPVEAALHGIMSLSPAQRDQLVARFDAAFDCKTFDITIKFVRHI